jgi:hypothetical protein
MGSDMIRNPVKMTAKQGRELITPKGMVCMICSMLILDKKAANIEIDEKRDETIVSHTRCYLREATNKKA